MDDKMLGVIALFDEHTSEKFNNLYEILYKQGFIGTQTKNVPYHFTFGTYESNQEDMLIDLLDRVGNNTKCIDFRFNHVERFGYDINPYLSVEDAINTWPTTATSIGVRLEDDSLKIYAPFGLNDLFGMIVKANKAQITEKIFMQKASKWSAKWPTITIIPW